ncbi:hypothetical protein GQ44DRAFT_767002 [Phaeosphaeriaceae sp. PMI808]|nr:hypothetical protein GQ44DRAFT_767002 [Phaeosphaeriaceae sp. PMI808]
MLPAERTAKFLLDSSNAARATLERTALTLTPPSRTPIHAFVSSINFISFLQREHSVFKKEEYAKLPGVQIKFPIRPSKIPSITDREAVEAALCYGWIKGRQSMINPKWRAVRFAPRQPKTLWSLKDFDTAMRLIKEKRMRPPGLQIVEVSKADGTWDRARTMLNIPEDLKAAFAKELAAKIYFKSLTRSQRFGVLMHLASVPEEERETRIESLVQLLADGVAPGVVNNMKKVADNRMVEDNSKRKSVETEPVSEEVLAVRDALLRIEMGDDAESEQLARYSMGLQLRP